MGSDPGRAPSDTGRQPALAVAAAKRIRSRRRSLRRDPTTVASPRRLRARTARCADRSRVRPLPVTAAMPGRTIECTSAGGFGPGVHFGRRRRAGGAHRRAGRRQTAAARRPRGFGGAPARRRVLAIVVEALEAAHVADLGVGHCDALEAGRDCKDSCHAFILTC